MSDHMHDNGIKEGARGYQTSDGQWHDTMSEARAYQNGSADGGAMGEMTNIFGAVFGPIILLGIVGTIIWVAIKQYAFYILPVAGFLFLTNLLPRILGLKKGGIGAGVLLAATICCIVFAKNVYYPNIIEPSPFTADYLISEAAIHSKRNSGGKELALVPSGEKVTVNGVSRDRAEFNITAKDGSTGWIPASAFPKDANVLPDDIGSLMKSWMPFVGASLQKEFARDYMTRGDRDWFNSMEKVAAYFDLSSYAVENGEGALYPPNTENAEIYDDTWPSFNSIVGLKDSLVNRALQINQPFTATINAENRGSRKLSALFKKVDRKVFSGPVEATLRYVLYLPEVTIISVYPEDHEFANEFGYTRSNEEEYHDSLVLKDLDSGETFPLLRAFDLGGVLGGGAGEILYMFPSVTTRHFALVHEKKNTRKKEYDVWDIPEVSVAANAPTMANDPFERALRRAANFKGNGDGSKPSTIAITTNNLRLYPEEIPRVLPGNSKDYTAVYPEPLAVIPAGEVVTVLDRNYWFSKVKYKDLEGYVNEDFLK